MLQLIALADARVQRASSLRTIIIDNRRVVPQLNDAWRVLAPPGFFHEQLLRHSLSGKLLDRLLLRDDVDQILLDNPISPGDDPAVSLAAACIAW